jgi:hypothetical protein
VWRSYSDDDGQLAPTSFEIPSVRFARRPDGRLIACRVVGEPGGVDLIFILTASDGSVPTVVGQRSVADVMDDGSVKVDGPQPLVRSLPRWFLLRASGPPVAGASVR